MQEYTKQITRWMLSTFFGGGGGGGRGALQDSAEKWAKDLKKVFDEVNW